MSRRLGEALFYSLAATFVEKKVLPSIGLSFLQEPTYLFALPRSYGLLVLILSVTYLWVLMLGMTVSHSRQKYMSLAEKDGEKDIEERYAYPNLYARA
jgi:hypothetical protein